MKSKTESEVHEMASASPTAFINNGWLTVYVTVIVERVCFISKIPLLPNRQRIKRKVLKESHY